jgi:hypothetical protein
MTAGPDGNIWFTDLNADHIGQFVTLWSHQQARGAAHQLAAAEGFTWPLPVEPVDPWKRMKAILAWETDELRHRPLKPLAA